MKPIDGDALIAAIEQMMKYQIDADDICEMIQNFQPIEPEHIHCKDCRWFEPDRHQCGRQICAVFYEDDYCSFAERRTDEGD